MKKYSYVLLGDPYAVEGTKSKKSPLLSGLWQISLAFDKYGKKGDVRLIRRKAEFEEYDCVHVNMTGGNFSLLNHIRDELGTSSSTKLIANIDFDVGSWGKNWAYPGLLEKGLQCADLVFHVESRAAALLEHVLKRPVPVLPHPVDVDGLDAYKKIEREPYVVNVYHRYYPDITTGYWCIRDLPLHSVLLGYVNGKVPPLPMYDEYYGHIPFLDAIDIMSQAKFGLDLFHGYNYGRVVCEFAALAVPCVCSETIDASHRLFPDLVVNPFDVKRANELFREMINDDDFYQDVFKKAYRAVGFYSQKACYDRLVETLEDVEGRKAITATIPSEVAWRQIQSRYEKKTNLPKPKKWMDFLIHRGNQFKAFIGVKGLVLDLGCGNGKYLGKSYEEAGYVYINLKNQIIGLDPLKSYEERFPVISARGEKIPLQDGIFNAVVLATSMDHIVSPKRALKEIKRVLTPNGSVFIWSAVMSNILTNPGHLHTWTDIQLIEEVEQIFVVKKFEVLQSKAFGNQIFIEGVKNDVR